MLQCVPKYGIRLISAIKCRKGENLMPTKEYHFQKLTPINNADISVYEEAINFAFENSDIKNVAISGPYSAGKTSILESYKAKHTDHHFMHLSLAHFRTPEQEESESEEPVKESILEGKILNQLIHQIPAEKIPQTNFRVKKGVSICHLVWLTILTSFFVGSITFLCFFHSAEKFVTKLPDGWIKNVLSIAFDPYVPIITTLICVICSVIIIFLLIKAQKNRNIFRKISLQGNEIEIFEEQDDSYFDKYLNEVLYLFENAEADVIVFEDMDRFNASRIFERLREVNTLVNVQRKKTGGEKYAPLRFFYLLRDDIFISKDRTKFFDYVIPIVPVVDSSNSYEQFLKHLKAGKLIDNFDLSFLQSLSLYVDDMRILKNIYNEFVVYIHRLNTTDLDWNKMMAMITYKNLFPRDFNDLQLSRGFIFALFEQKPLLAQEALVEAQKQRKNLLDRIECAKKETMTSLQELDDVFAAKNARLPRYYGRLTEQGEVLKKQYENDLKKRQHAVQDIADGKIRELEAEVAGIDHDIMCIQTKALKDLITRENIDTIFLVNHTNEIQEISEFKEIKGSDYFPLLKFLIRNGHIDETYPDYMTYFYEDSISANDKIFLRHITDRRGAEYTYRLKEPMKVIASPVLRDVGFEQEETLNFDLLECLLLHDSSKYTTYLKILIDQIKEAMNFDFISKFYDTDKAREKFVIKLNEQWPDFFSLALQRSMLPATQIRKYSIDTLYSSSNDILAAVNVDHCLTRYISYSSDYLNAEQPNIDKLISSFMCIDIRFAAINYEDSHKELFHAVYEHSLYALTFPNIALMLQREYGIQSNSDIVHKNYTLIKGQDSSPLAEYISENISAYVEIILANCNGEISDNEAIAVSLLNNAEVETDKKEKYIGMLSTVIGDITIVTDASLWPIMLDGKVAAFSEKNFINYFQKQGLDEILVRYLNNASSEIDFSIASAEFGDEVANKLFETVAICNGVSTEKYKKILTDLGFIFNRFDMDKINDDKFEVLVKEHILTMNPELLEFVRKKYPNHIYGFIGCNLDEYLSLQTPEIFSLNEALQLATWDITDEQKIGLLAFSNDPISIVGTQYPDAVNAYILTHNLQKEDRDYLFTHYTCYGEKAQKEIVSLAEAEVRTITSNAITLDDRLLSILLQSDIIARNQKILLFNNAIPTLNEETCKKHFDELDLSELKGIFSKGGGRRNYQKTNETTEILAALKANGWIYEYRDDERNGDKYIIIKNKPRSKEPDASD